jgi:hypothetical protein
MNIGTRPNPETGDPSPVLDAEGVFRVNLGAFGGRAARVCILWRRGRLSSEKCFLALAQLWDQLANAQRRRGGAMGSCPKKPGAPGDPPVDWDASDREQA